MTCDEEARFQDGGLGLMAYCMILDASLTLVHTF